MNPPVAVCPETYWVGTLHSYNLAMEAYARVAAGPTAEILAYSQSDQEDQEDLPYMLSIQGDIGVVTIRGPLLNIDTPYAKYYGVSTYADIRRAMVAAAHHEEVKAIVMDIASGGGAVSGVDDTANLISTIAKQVKPVYAYTDGIMASAAYWLGCSASEVFCSRTSVVGSIGVIQTFIGQAKVMKNAGYDVHVLRAGKFKALLNPNETPSAEALAQAEAQLEAVYGVFLEHVAAQRGVTPEAADAKMAQGREFIGQQAVEAGLVNALDTFDSLMSRIGAKIADSERMSQPQYRNHTGQPMKTALTDQQIAAIAAGAPAAAAAAGSTAPVASTAPAPDVPPAPAGDAQAAAAAAAPAVTETKEEKDNQVIAYLKGELTAASASLMSMTVKASSMEAELSSTKANVQALSAIAARSLSNMQVAMGQPAIDASSMAPDVLLAAHSAASTAFQTTFKVGGVAAVNPEQSESKGPDLRHLQRVAATSLKK